MYELIKFKTLCELIRAVRFKKGEYADIRKKVYSIRAADPQNFVHNIGTFI